MSGVFPLKSADRSWRRPALACLLIAVLSAWGLEACSGPQPPRDDAWKRSDIAARYARIQAAHPNAPDISVDQAMELARQGRALFVDVRTPAERAVSTLPGAVDLETFLADPALSGPAASGTHEPSETAGTDAPAGPDGAASASGSGVAAPGGREIIVYCTIGERSAATVENLRSQGIPAFNLAGSILAWTHIGGPLVDASGKPTRRVHVYARDWDLAASDYQSVW